MRGASGLILIGECTDPYSVEAVASMGAIQYLSIACSNLLWKFAASWQGRIVGTALSHQLITEKLIIKAIDFAMVMNDVA